jgi:thiamine kinase-like enzyme
VNTDTLALLENSFSRIPKLSNYSIDLFDIKQLPGYTNLNFHLKNNQHDWVLRIPKDETNRHINRITEASNADIAFELGLAPKCDWRDSSGYSLSNTIRQSRSLEVRDLNNPMMLKQVVTALQQLHQSSELFEGTVDINDLLSRYYQLMPKSKQQLLADHYQDAATKAKNVLQQAQRLVPSHNDLVLENILFDGHKVWVIDWEYASMASPYWDLATLCNQAQFSPSQVENLLRLYRNGDRSLDLKMLTDYRDILNVLSIFWMAAFTDDEALIL